MTPPVSCATRASAGGCTLATAARRGVRSLRTLMTGSSLHRTMAADACARGCRQGDDGGRADSRRAAATGDVRAVHGRDVFAPVAAHLAAGVAIGRFGARVGDPVLLDVARPVRDEDSVRGVVVHIDHFGNLITNIPHECIDADARVVVDGRDVGPVRRTYGDVATDALVALIGSDALLEIGVPDGSGADVLGAVRGADVLVRNALQQDS